MYLPRWSGSVGVWAAMVLSPPHYLLFCWSRSQYNSPDVNSGREKRGGESHRYLTSIRSSLSWVQESPRHGCRGCFSLLRNYGAVPGYLRGSSRVLRHKDRRRYLWALWYPRDAHRSSAGAPSCYQRPLKTIYSRHTVSEYYYWAVIRERWDRGAPIPQMVMALLRRDSSGSPWVLQEHLRCRAFGGVFCECMDLYRYHRGSAAGDLCSFRGSSGANWGSIVWGFGVHACFHPLSPMLPVVAASLGLDRRRSGRSWRSNSQGAHYVASRMMRTDPSDLQGSSAWGSVVFSSRTVQCQGACETPPEFFGARIAEGTCGFSFTVDRSLCTYRLRAWISKAFCDLPQTLHNVFRSIHKHPTNFHHPRVVDLESDPYPSQTFAILLAEMRVNWLLSL